MKLVVALTGTVLAFALAGASTPAVAGGYYQSQKSRCTNCAPSKHYDTRRMVRKTRDVDHSRVVHSRSVVPYTRVINTNHLVVRHNRTRHVGTVHRHHTVLHRQLIVRRHNVDYRTINSAVNHVRHTYSVDHRRLVEVRDVPGRVRYLGSTPRSHSVHSYSYSPRYISARY